jgi:hypothetical protein
MSSRAREPSDAVRRVLENAGILIFASLLVMSIALGRYTGALVWCGALMVFFAQAWEGRASRHGTTEIALPPAPGGARPRHYDALRWVGVALSLLGAAALAV